ncbi:MAG: zinc-binding alcohol dehydrogenase [Planctomycetota bacterium]|nr:zinc-binding alcohol dehydrogenase [Planctomycetota bacterium]MDA1143039.1 zinc-binding alcohol dehydrogenase [Planctomycetota bacterium]
MSELRLIATVCGDGKIRPIEELTPELKPGAVLVEVKSSLISPGTELGSWHGLARRRQAPNDSPPRKFGYANSGVVAALGEGVEEFQPGDRVGCIGAGFAQHATWAVVPHHLCVRLPDNVSHDQGAYAMLAATGLHTMRRCEPQFGEYAAIVGLGLVGQLTAQLFQLAGNFVIGWDMIETRRNIASEWGIHATTNVDGDQNQRTKKFTGGMGLDSAVFAFGGDGTEAVNSITQCMKLSPDTHRMGTLVIVGGMSFDFKAVTTNLDFRRAARTGPGYHDDQWEYGEPYPPVFMRWTTRTNLELCMRLISEGRLNVDCLTTHRVPIEEAEEKTDGLLDSPDELLGVVFEMNR